MKFGVIVFPGSNCDRDMMHALRDDLQQDVVMLWHKDHDLSMFGQDDCIVLHCREVFLMVIIFAVVHWPGLAL